MPALPLWFTLGLVLAAYGAFVASHYYAPTLRQQAACFIGAYVALFAGLTALGDDTRGAVLGRLSWMFSTRTTLSDSLVPLAICAGLFGLWLMYFIPRYQTMGLGDPQGTIREVRFPFKAASLTFDDGPSPEWTPKILDVLDRHRVKATFFLVGEAVERHPEVAAEIARRGHSIGSHSHSHRPLPLLDARSLCEEIDRAADAIEKATGKRPQYFRPPWGFFNRRVLIELRARGYLTVLWTRSSQDWRNPGPEVVEALGAADPKLGDIILLHDGGNYPSKTPPTTSRADTVEGVDRIIRRLERSGFQCRSMDEMVAAWMS
ncbi:MAG: polysaccharide deacetylase family protein [Proteobacteria bacterium]|nr:polysaccharide deacetylase family protein [Pseudomonadota bacterium]